MSEGDRRYLCSNCDSVVRARWNGAGSFHVGCDCTTVPVVPQMGQAETPESWVVERPLCCRGVDVKEMERIYGGVGEEYKCQLCGATYDWKGTMASAPTDPPQPEDAGDNETLMTDGGTEQTDTERCPVCGGDTVIYSIGPEGYDCVDCGHVWKPGGKA